MTSFCPCADAQPPWQQGQRGIQGICEHAQRCTEWGSQGGKGEGEVSCWEGGKAAADGPMIKSAQGPVKSDKRRSLMLSLALERVEMP